MGATAGPGLTATLATIRCHHYRRIQERPCGRCSAQALKDIRTHGEPLIRRTADILMDLDGYTGKPTPLTYSAAVHVLNRLIPFMAQQKGTADDQPETEPDPS